MAWAVGVAGYEHPGKPPSALELVEKAAQPDLNRAQTLLPGGMSWIIGLWAPWQGIGSATLSLESLWVRESVETLKVRMGI